MKKIMLLIIFLSLNHLLYSQLKPNQLRISGRNILDGNGNVIRLVGINHAHAWYRGYLGSALQGIRSWGANSVRVVLSCGYRWTKIPANEVSTIINQARSLGFKAIVLEVHDTTGYGQDSSACDLQTAVNYWREIKSVLDGNEDFVIINIGNEPWGNNNTSGWVNATKSAIQALRQAGFTHVIMCDAPCWGQDWDNTMRNNAQNVLSADSLNNTILSVHMYGVYNTSSKVNSYMSYYYNNNLPLCVGEFGHYHTDGDPDEQAIVSYAQQYGISIWGWSWCGNGGGVEYLDMVYNWNENSPTNWGSWFKSNALTSLPQTYTLSVSINPAGSGSVSLNPSGGTYTAGTQVTLTATANSGYIFSSWGGDLTGTQNPVVITMNSNKSVTANFVQSGSANYTLTINVSPQGSGVVYLNPSGGVYTAGTQVTLTAVANSGYIFDRWSGDITGTQNPVTIVMNSTKTVVCNFKTQTYTLAINVSPQGAGTVNLSPAGGVYTAGTQVTLTAVANSGYIFDRWSGDLTGTTNPATIVMDSNKSITANFVVISTQPGGGGGNVVITTYTLTVDIEPEGSGSVMINPSGGVYIAGTTVTLVAQAASGYKFSGWTGSITSQNNTVSIVMDSNKNVVAHFTVISSTQSQDQQPRIISINLQDNQQLVGEYTIEVSCDDDIGISKLEFYIDGVLVQTLLSQPYSYMIDTTDLSNGSHTLMVVVYDTSGQVDTLDKQFIVNNQLSNNNTDVAQSKDNYILTLNKDGKNDTIDFGTDVVEVKLYDTKGKLVYEDKNKIENLDLKVGLYICISKDKSGKTKINKITIVK